MAALVEFADLLVGKGVGQAEHRGPMGDGAELIQRRGADALRRGVRGEKIGKLRFKIGQLPEEKVVIGVGNLRIVQLVVTTIMVEDGRPVGFDPGFRCFTIHRASPRIMS